MSHAEWIGKWPPPFFSLRVCIDRDNLLFSCDWCSLVLLPHALADPVDLLWESNSGCETTCDLCTFRGRASFSASCSLWFPLRMRVDVEKTAEQRLATFQKHEAKSPFTHSDLRLSVPGVAAPLPNHLRLASPKTQWGCRNWNYLCMIDFFPNLFSFLKTKNSENASAGFVQCKQMKMIPRMWRDGWWVRLGSEVSEALCKGFCPFMLPWDVSALCSVY